MDSWSRQYYDKSLGAGMFVSPVTENGLIGYSEPLRRFIQHEGFSPQVNEIPNEMPSWIPGDDYLTNFHFLVSTRSVVVVRPCDRRGGHR